MPYKCEKLIKLAGTSQDRRRKLSDEQKDEITIVSKFYNFYCEDFDVRPIHDDSCVQEITLPYYINDFEKDED